MSKKATLTIGFLFLLFLSPPAYGAVPKMLNYQGRLTDENDVLQTSTHYLQFLIYDAASDGNLLWSSYEDFASDCGVAVTPSDGVFNVIIGDDTVENMSDIDIDFDAATYYLQIKISATQGSNVSCESAGAGASYETLDPRQRIVSSGYTFTARQISGDNNEEITSPSDDLLALVGVGGGDDTDLYINLDGTYPVLYSNTDTKVGIDDDLEFVDAQSITTSANNLTLAPAGNLAINTTGGTIDIDDGTIDLSTQAVDVTLNSVADALNFDLNTLSIDASSDQVGVGTASPDNLLSLNEASGDVLLDFDLNDADKWVLGVDDSDSDYLKINSGNTLADTSDLALQDDGDLLIGGDLTVGLSASNDDDIVYFDDGSSESLMWDDAGNTYIADNIGFVLSDDLEIGGNIVRNGSLSINAYGNSDLILQAGGNNILTLNYGNYITFGGAASAPTGAAGRMYYDTTNNSMYFYDGSLWRDMQGVTAEFIAPEYPSSVIACVSGSCTGTLITGYELDSNVLYTFYRWRGTGGGTDYDVGIHRRVPDNFTSWASSAIVFSYKTESGTAADNYLEWWVYEDGNASPLCHITNLNNTSWSTSTFTGSSCTCDGGGCDADGLADLAAGDTYFIRVRLYDNAGDPDAAYAGKIVIYYQ
jgi:hypothetical protein